MLLVEMKDMIMFQTNNDVDDLGDFMPYLVDYINEGYDRLVYAWAKVHPSDEVGAEWPRLHEDSDEPLTPVWTHRAVVDWATWLIYRNGNPQKQNRGLPFRQSSDEILAKVMNEGGSTGNHKKFINIPR